MYLKATAKFQSLMRGVDFHVILPYHDGYPDADRPYPTLYFLPGFSCNAEEIVFALPLRQMSALYGVAVVVPDGENMFYTDHPERAACMGRFAGEELAEVARKMFPCLSHRREDTYLGGISMGGYGAAALGMRYARTYSKLVLFSPAIEADTLLLQAPDSPGALPSSLFEALLGSPENYRASARLNPYKAIEDALEKGESMPEIWMCCGEEDPAVRDACHRFDAWLEGCKAPHQTVFGPGGHDYLFWDEHLEEAFHFLRGKPRF